MPNHYQLNLLDLCSGDGALSNNLVGMVARIQQVTIDPVQVAGCVERLVGLLGEEWRAALAERVTCDRI